MAKLSKVLFNSLFISATKAEVEEAQETFSYEVTGCNENSPVSLYIGFLTALENKTQMNLYYNCNPGSRS